MSWPAPNPKHLLALELNGPPPPYGYSWDHLARQHTKCEQCAGSGVEAYYSGSVHMDTPNGTASIKFNRVPGHIFHQAKPKGLTFYGGSEHHQCRNCKGTGKDPAITHPDAPNITYHQNR